VGVAQSKQWREACLYRCVLFGRSRCQGGGALAREDVRERNITTAVVEQVEWVGAPLTVRLLQVLEQIAIGSTPACRSDRKCHARVVPTTARARGAFAAVDTHTRQPVGWRGPQPCAL
jgi:hypothetical protein